MTLPARSGLPVGLFGRITTMVLDAVMGVIALPTLWALESLALSVLFQDGSNFAGWTYDTLSVAPCLLWLAVLLVRARRGRTPASIVTRRRWVDAAGQPASWGPLGSLSFWLAAWPTLFVLLLFGEELCLTGQAPIGWPPTFANYGPGLVAACLMIVAIAAPPYLRCRRLAALFVPARR